MDRKTKTQRRIKAIEHNTHIADVKCRVGFLVHQSSYKAKTKTGFKLKRKSKCIQIRVTICGVVSGFRSTGIPLLNPQDFDRSNLTIEGDPVGSARLQVLCNDIQRVFNERLLSRRSLNSNLVLDIAMGLATHEDEHHYIMGKTSDRTPIRDQAARPRVPNAISAINNYIALKEQLLHNGLSPLTYQRYKQYGDILTGFIKKKYNVKLFLDDLTPAVEYDLFAYLKGNKKYAHNYAVKIIQFFKSLLTYAHAHRWVDRNVLAAVRLTKHHKEVKTLTMANLVSLASRDFAEPSLNQVRDIFLFCCYTGLAYTDVASLAPRHIVEVEGVDCILKDRNKSGVQSFVPLFPEAIVILNRYAQDPICQLKGVLLPVISNAKTNASLKVIGNIVGIKEPLHTHLARKTFTMFVEERGFSIDHMAVMLGHTRATMTEQFYHRKRQAPVLKVFKDFYADGEIKRLAS